MLAVLILAASILLFSGASAVVTFARDSWMNLPGPAIANLNNRGPHGLTEILYAYSSATGNNGSAFAGINTNTPWFNTTMGLGMWIGRFLTIIPLLAVAGSLARKKLVPASAGTLPTGGGLFAGLLVVVVLVVGALTFFPALALGPVVEHFLMEEHRLFSFLVLGLWG
jgi:potassium-transporting ATPase potassium-binding subunit